MFIVSLTYKCPIEEIEKHIDAHIAYLKQGYANGHFIVSGKKVPRTGGILMSKVKTRGALEEILKKDPFQINDLVEYEIIEFAPSMTAKGLEALL